MSRLLLAGVRGSSVRGPRVRTAAAVIAAAALWGITPGTAQAPDDELAALDTGAREAEPAPTASSPTDGRAALELPAGAREAPTPTASPPTDARAALALPARAAASRRVNNLFAAHSWYIAPPPPPPMPEPPAPVPTAPPLPFQYVGNFQQGDSTVYFLTRGDRTYDVKIGDVVDDTYSVDAVSNDQLVFTYLPLKERQVLQLGKSR